MSSFEIAGRRVGGDAPVFIVAELSANHGQRLDRALETIDAAAKAGADAIKLQTYTPDTLTLKCDAPPFVVRTKNEWAGRTLYDLYTEAMTPWDWHAELIRAAAAVGLPCFSTPFDATAVEFLERLNVPAHKVASFELTDLTLVERVARTGRPIILSTGMATLSEIDAAVRVCRGAGNESIALLRCVSCYPALPESMALRSLDVLRGFGVVLGLSDHTRDATAAIASVALGAKVIEKHFILDRKLGGPDAFFSLEPSEFRAMVDAVRATEKAIGGPRFGPAADELPNTAFRRSLFVARDVEAGSVLTCDDVRSVRPAHGLPPQHLPSLLGKTAARGMRLGTPLTWDAVGPAPEVTTPVVLRAAVADDAERLLAWRNDPVARAMSLNESVVSAEEHERWFAAALRAQERVVLVAEAGGVPVGVVRLDAGVGNAWEVSIAVAPEARLRKLAVGMLHAAEAAGRERGAVLFTATIKTKNEASVRTFKKAGYYGFIERALPSGSAWICERRVAPYV
jgi:pseudaminic acid synthase